MSRPERDAGGGPYRNTGTCADAYGDRIEIGTIGDTVSVIFHRPDGSFIGMHLYAEQREEFQRLFMEAERQAEAQQPAAPEADVDSMRVFPIYARFAHPGNGYDADRREAAEHLTPGRSYLIDHMDVGRSHTALYLHDFPGIAFNSVMFAAGSDPDAE